MKKLLSIKRKAFLIACFFILTGMHSCCYMVVGYDPSMSKEETPYYTYLKLGRAYFENNDLDDALIKFDRAISIDTSRSEAIKGRGVVLFYLNRFGEALKAFKKNDQDKSLDSDSILWVYLTTKKLGKDGLAVLENWNKMHEIDINDFLADPLVSIYLGKMRPSDLTNSDLLNDGAVKDYSCDKYFHIGQYYLLRGDKEKASKMFQIASKAEACELIERAAAKMELNRL